MEKWIMIVVIVFAVIGVMFLFSKILNGLARLLMRSAKYELRKEADDERKREIEAEQKKLSEDYKQSFYTAKQSFDTLYEEYTISEKAYKKLTQIYSDYAEAIKTNYDWLSNQIQLIDLALTSNEEANATELLEAMKENVQMQEKSLSDFQKHCLSLQTQKPTLVSEQVFEMQM